MSAKRRVEIFSAGCGVCDDTVELVRALACPSCVVEVLEMRRDDVLVRAKALGIRSVPAVVVDGTLADCCAGRGVDEEALRRAGVGHPLA